MNRKLIGHTALPLLILALAGVIGFWLFHNPVQSFTLSVPGMDKRGETDLVNSEVVTVGEHFRLISTMVEESGTRWPGFRGPERDNISREQIPLIDRFDEQGAKILWKVDLGEGHAAPAVYDGRVYLLDYDEKEKADMLRCFSLATGQELWRRWYRVHLKRNHGLSRTVPAVNGQVVVTIGPRCHVMCVDRITGDLKWSLDLVKEYGTEVPFWYTGQCPLIDGEAVILAPGGKSLMIALDISTGKLLWECPNPKGWKMSHSSIMTMTLNGKKSYIYAAVGGICGVSSGPGDAGRLLWTSSDFAPSVVAPSPVVLPGGRIFMTAGYGAGSVIIQVDEKAGTWTARIIDQYKPQEGLASEQQTPVLADGHLFAILPKDAGGARNQFVCCSAADGRKLTMTSGKETRFGLGPYLLADGKFFILNDDGELTIARASRNAFRLLSRTRVVEGQDAWGPMVVTGGYLLMRDTRQLFCIDIREKGEKL